jgi:hypothetical protein
MQIQWYSQSIYDYLDKVACRFVRKGLKDKRIHLVSWDKRTRHNRLGNLDIHIDIFQNVPLLDKLVWYILTLKDKLWVTLFKDIYLGENLVSNATTRKGSPAWNSTKLY